MDRQEVDRMQRVIKTVYTNLTDLKLAIDGTIVMSQYLRDSLDAMYDARIPERWQKVGDIDYINVWTVLLPISWWGSLKGPCLRAANIILIRMREYLKYFLPYTLCKHDMDDIFAYLSWWWKLWIFVKSEEFFSFNEF